MFVAAADELEEQVRISGMDTLTSGHVSFAGQDLTVLKQKQLARLRLTTMGFIFQHVHLLKNLCLLDNIVLPAYLAGLAPRAELTARARELMERTGVGELADRDISQASGGQLQRVGICRALDSTAAVEVMKILADLNAEGTTIMLVTHDAKVAAWTDRLLYMVDGRIVADRRQARQPGARIEEPHADVTQWLLSQTS